MQIKKVQTSVNKLSLFSKIIITIVIFTFAVYSIIMAMWNTHLNIKIAALKKAEADHIKTTDVYQEHNTALIRRNTIGTLEVHTSLVTRNKWLWASLISGGIVIAGAAATVPAWAPVFVSGLFGKIVVSVIVSIGTALGVAGTYGAVAVGKRHNGYNSNSYHGMLLRHTKKGEPLYYYDVINMHGQDFHNKLLGSNNFTYIAYTINSTTSDSQGGVIAKSRIGNHTFSTTTRSTIGKMLKDIALQQAEDCYGECFLRKTYGLGNATINRRTQYYDVDWTSYNYDIWSEEYRPETEYPGLSLQDVEDSINESYANDGDPDTWKYCMCIDGDTTGTYNDMVIKDGMAGELYFNTYGGIDGYCNTQHCGAQCSTDGCT